MFHQAFSTARAAVFDPARTLLSLVAAVCFLAISAPSFAQETTSSIRGNVVTSDGQAFLVLPSPFDTFQPEFRSRPLPIQLAHHDARANTPLNPNETEIAMEAFEWTKKPRRTRFNGNTNSRIDGPTVGAGSSTKYSLILTTRNSY